MNLVFMQLCKIEFIRRDDQFVGYQQAATEWMKQWTVRNNYKSLVVEAGDERYALEYWRDELMSAIRNTILNTIPVEYRETYSFGKDFQFSYQAESLKTLEPFWLLSGSGDKTIMVRDI